MLTDELSGRRNKVSILACAASKAAHDAAVACGMPPAAGLMDYPKIATECARAAGAVWDAAELAAKHHDPR